MCSSSGAPAQAYSAPAPRQEAREPDRDAMLERARRRQQQYTNQNPNGRKRPGQGFDTILGRNLRPGDSSLQRVTALGG